MTLLIIVLALLVVAGGVAHAKGAFRSSGKRAGAIPARRRPLGRRDQLMYLRLREALPDHVVLAQVAFSSLLMARDRTLRHQLRAKAADFVVCTRHFEVLGILQLCDEAQRRRQNIEQEHDALLTSSGYKVIRYTDIPDAHTLKADIAKLPVPEAPKLPAVSKSKQAAKAADSLPALDL